MTNLVFYIKEVQITKAKYSNVMLASFRLEGYCYISFDEGEEISVS